VMNSPTHQMPGLYLASRNRSTRRSSRRSISHRRSYSTSRRRANIDGKFALCWSNEFKVNTIVQMYSTTTLGW
jgi:hypothetical protein